MTVPVPTDFESDVFTLSFSVTKDVSSSNYLFNGTISSDNAGTDDIVFTDLSHTFAAGAFDAPSFELLLQAEGKSPYANISDLSVSVGAIPEPASLSLGSGLIALLFLAGTRRRLRRR